MLLCRKFCSPTNIFGYCPTAVREGLLSEIFEFKLCKKKPVKNDAVYIFFKAFDIPPKNAPGMDEGSEGANATKKSFWCSIGPLSH